MTVILILLVSCVGGGVRTVAVNETILFIQQIFVALCNLLSSGESQLGW